jgi:hypothetical protein
MPQPAAASGPYSSAELDSRKMMDEEPACVCWSRRSLLQSVGRLASSSCVVTAVARGKPPLGSFVCSEGPYRHRCRSIVAGVNVSQLAATHRAKPQHDRRTLSTEFLPVSAKEVRDIANEVRIDRPDRIDEESECA